MIASPIYFGTVSKERLSSGNFYSGATTRATISIDQYVVISPEGTHKRSCSEMMRLLSIQSNMSITEKESQSHGQRNTNWTELPRELQTDENREDSDFAPNIDAAIERIFDNARHERFEDGTESDFAKALACTVIESKEDSVLAIFSLLEQKKISPQVISQALQCLGDLREDSTHTLRLWLLAHYLRHVSAEVRDGAALGLGLLADTTAIRYLENAIQKEEIPSLQKDMKAVLADLKV